MPMLAYAIAMTVLGGAVYGLCFLYLPLQTLRAESLRWKRMLRLAPN